MRIVRLLLCALAFTSLASSPSPAQWLDFNEETPDRLTLVTVPVDDDEEKDVAVGDLDKDGWDDVIVVRKEPFSNPGARTDVILMNDGGVLVDMTETYAPTFMTIPTDARDVALVDVNGDTWLDVVIANTFHQQPELYINKGTGIGGWQGLQRESGLRLPYIEPGGQNPGPGPLFCGVSSGDIEGDGDPDLFFSNYNPGGGATEDFLLVNDGNGYFTDETDARLGQYKNVAFGTGGMFHDMDNDDDLDLVKISTLFEVPPFNDLGVFIMFNDGNGVFSDNPFHAVPTSEAYMFMVDYFNEDDRLDMYVVQDGQDRVNFNEGSIQDQSITWDVTTLENSPRTSSFGGNVATSDLDGDGDRDMGVAPVDVDIQNCSGGFAGEFALLRNDDGALSDPYGQDTNVHQRPHDFAFVDLDRDGCDDIFMGLCIGFSVLMQMDCQSSSAPETRFAGPGGVSVRAEPNPTTQETRLELTLSDVGDGNVTVKMYDVRGALVRTLWSGTASRMPSSIHWDGRDESGNAVSGGIYFARIEGARSEVCEKILLIR